MHDWLPEETAIMSGGFSSLRSGSMVSAVRGRGGTECIGGTIPWTPVLRNAAILSKRHTSRRLVQRILV